MSGSSAFPNRRLKQLLGDQGGTLTADSLPSWLIGGTGADTLLGGIANDSLFGGIGHDLLDGGAGRDRLMGEVGNDTIRGGLGEDSIEGGEGNDSLDGGDGADFVLGGAGHDFVWGGTGNDTIRGDAGDDTIRSGDGVDSLLGGEGDDVLCPASGDDLVWGGEGNDIIWGGDGHDFGRGGYGNDLLTGGNGNDTLRSCEGNDFMLSRSDAGEPAIAARPGMARVFAGVTLAGNDIMDGGPNADTFRFELLVNARPEVIARHMVNGTVDWAGVVTENANAHDHWVDGIGNDTIQGYARGAGDKLEIFGHDIEIASIVQRQATGDLRTDTVISLRSKGGGAHGADLLGTITVDGDRLTRADIDLRDNVVIGAFSTLEFGQFPGDRFGTFPHGFTGLEPWAM